MSYFFRRIVLPACTAFFILMLPMASYAQGNEALGIRNPLTIKTVAEFIERSLRAVVQIALPVIAFFIVYSGFLFVSARGNESQLTDAKKNIKYVLIGTALILGSWALATLIAGTVTELLR